MKIDISKKTLIIIVSSVAGIIVLGGIFSFIFHGRHEGRNFGDRGCGANQAQMLSGIENVVATKDYAAFQTLFSGSRVLEQINTQEKFTTRVEIQTTMKKLQELQAQLGSGNKEQFGPMMMGNSPEGPQGCPMIGRGNERGNMTPAHRGQVRRR